MRWFLAIFAATLVWSVGSHARAELQVGDPAPDFRLTGSDGKTYTLSDFKDKQVVVLAWFPKAFTGGCTAECNSLRSDGIDEGYVVELLGGRTFEVKPTAGSGLRQLDAAYFMASCDDAETNKRYATEMKLDFPVLSDPTKQTAEAYGVVHEGRPNPERWTFYIGKDGKILHIDKQVNTGTHGQDIAKKLQELGVPPKP